MARTTLVINVGDRCWRQKIILSLISRWSLTNRPNCHALQDSVIHHVKIVTNIIVAVTVWYETGTWTGKFWTFCLLNSWYPQAHNRVLLGFVIASGPTSIISKLVYSSSPLSLSCNFRYFWSNFWTKKDFHYEYAMRVMNSLTPDLENVFENSWMQEISLIQICCILYTIFHFY